MRPKLPGAIAAAVTPLRDGGRSLDETSIAPLLRFLAEGGMDGALTCGTTGEGILLTVEERRRVTELAVAARPEGFAIAVHAGAQTTADTVALASHARDHGADAVAVIAPPYFPLDERELFAHFAAAAAACDPLPFYVYEFIGRSGYPVPVTVIERLRDEVPNLAGLKVSDTPWERFAPYLIEGLDVFVGPEALIAQGITAGAVGAVSALATAFPELVVAAVRDPAGEAARHIGELRVEVERFPRHAALKRVLGLRGVPVREDVRAPLRRLTDDEREGLDQVAARWIEVAAGI